ncbi:NAD-dependent epimerase/dehydratase family protein [Candidatus Woesearchaeota archaeon]|nr:NAD-dependent epimerase/dehydratase family protein [Candidatus Woesearchaeota archaeon]
MKNKTVLMTGATGFLGSHLLRSLLDKGYDVIILKRSFSDTWRIDDLLDKARCYDLDKLKPDGLPRIYKDNKVDSVVHTATCYGRNDEQISEIVKSNLLLPLRLLELCADLGARTFVNADTFFNTGMELPKNMNYYVLSKKHFLEYAKRILEKNKLRFANMILGHMYGPKDNPSKFIPSVIKSMLYEKEVKLTKGEQKRDFVYVEDVASAFALVLEKADEIKDRYADIEVGSGKGIMLKELLLQIKEECRTECRLNFGALPYRKNEADEAGADTALLRKLGWKPEYSMEEGIAKTVAYCRDAFKP